MVRHSLFNALAGVASLGAAFLSGVIVARLLGLEAAGIVNFTVWAAMAGFVVVNRGIPTTLWRFIPAMRASEGFEATLILRNSLFQIFGKTIGTVLVVLIGFSGWQIWSGESESATLWVAGTLLFATYAGAMFTLAEMRGLQRFRDIALLSLLAVVLQIPMVALGAYLMGTLGAVLGYSLGQLPLAVGSMRLLPLLSKPTVEIQSDVRSYARDTWLAHLIELLVQSRIEILFLGYFLGPAAVAIFTVGMAIANLAVQLPIQFSGPLLPFFAARFAEGDSCRIRATYTSALRILAFLVVPACFGAAAITPELVPWLYGSDFVPAVVPAIILLAAAIAPALADVPSQMIYAAGHSRFFIYTGLAGGIATIASGLFVIPFFGVAGAASARLLIHVLIAAATFVYAGRLLGQSLPFRHLAAIFLSAALCGFAAIVTVESIGAAYGAVPAVLVGVVTYLGAIRAFGGLPKQDLERFLPATGSLPRPLGGVSRRVLNSLAR